MAVGTINWFVTVPQATRNLVTNPSFESGTAGWAGTGTPTLGTAAGSQWSGAWAAYVTGASGTRGVRAPVAAVAGTAYVASAYVKMDGVSGGSVQISLGGTTTLYGLGTLDGWQRVSVGTTGAAGSVAINRVASGGTLYIDAVQVEPLAVTTYCDGDQQGCTWEGAPHASASARSAQARSGGTVYSLARIGMRPETTPDTGVWPVVNIAQSYAVNAGAQFQRQRPDSRAFTLTTTFTGVSLADLHQTRRNVIDVLKLERVTPPQPTQLWYTGAAGTSTISAYYDAGLGWDGANVVSEQAQVRFVAHDPAWYGVGQQGTTLAPYTVLGSVNTLAYRDPAGRWGTFGVNGVTIDTQTGAARPGTVRTIVPANGTIYFGGRFGTVGGTVFSNGEMGVAQYVNGVFGTLTGGTLTTSSLVYGVAAMARNAGGTLFVAGDQNTAGGTASTGLSYWLPTGAWGTTTNGQVNDFGRAVIIDSTGGVVVGGGFTTAAGTRATTVARWTSAWGTLGPGSVGALGVFALTQDAVGSIVIGMTSTGSSLVNGTPAWGIARWGANTGWGTFANGSMSGASAFNFTALAYDAAQRLYVGGVQTYPGTAVTIYRGGGIQPAGSLGATVTSTNGVRSLLAAQDGNVYAAGVLQTINAGGQMLSFGLAQWNGYTWLPPDLILSSTGDAYALAQDASGTLYIGGSFKGIGTAASVTPVVNSGISEAYPTLRLRNTGATTARIYQLLNTTTGDSIWLDYVMSAGEQASLVLTPGNRSFTSSSRGNVLGAILGGSNLASWRLLPGTNTVSFLADSASVVADLYWTPRHSSIDGGAPGTY